MRLRAYLIGRSLWHDEAALARNIVDRSFTGLVRPLDYNQGAPLGFLWVEKLLQLTLGNRDYWLRLFPLLAGIGALVLMLLVARRYTLGVGIPIAVGLFALSGRAIYYSSEVKQYSSDGLAGVLLLLAVYPCFSPRSLTRQWLVLGFVGGVCLWFSHPAVFILAGIGLALLADFISRRQWDRLPWISGLVVFWMLNFIVIYWLSIRHLMNNPSLLSYWTFSYPPTPFWLHMDWFVDRVPVTLQNIMGVQALLGLVLCFLGEISLLRRTTMGIILIIAPLIALAAAAIQSYPFYERFLLFALPGLYILVGEGVEIVRNRLERLNPVLGVAATLVLVGFIFYTPVSQVWQNFRQPYMIEHLKPIMAYVQQSRQQNDTIYVYYGAEHAFVYYAEQFGFQEGDYRIGLASRLQPVRYLEQIDDLKGDRVWFVFSHNCYWCQVDEQVYIVTLLDGIGTRLAETHAPTASGYLFDLREAR